LRGGGSKQKRREKGLPAPRGERGRNSLRSVRGTAGTPHAQDNKFTVGGRRSKGAPGKEVLSKVTGIAGGDAEGIKS